LTPHLPKKPCSKGCGKLVSAGQRACEPCSEQAAQRKQHRPPGWKTRPRKKDNRPSSTARGYGARWQRYSRRFLSKHPLCVGCSKERSKAVDHIKPVSGPRDPNFWNPKNHQALGRNCHAKKTGQERRLGKTIKHYKRRNRR